MFVFFMDRLSRILAGIDAQGVEGPSIFLAPGAGPSEQRTRDEVADALEYMGNEGNAIDPAYHQL
jgi:hypothetical protein